MAQFKPILTVAQSANSVEEEAGQIIFAKDTGDIYVDDSQDNRFKLNTYSYYIYLGDRAGVVGNGVNNVASGEYSFAAGNANQATDLYSFAIGDTNVASGEGAVTVGQNNTAEGDYSCTIGENNSASGEGSFAAGNSNVVSGDNSTIVGENNIATGIGQFVAGKYNATNTNLYFIVGAGTASNQRRNILEVAPAYVNINGTLKINGADAIFGQVIQMSTLPTAASSNVGYIYQYIGDTTNDYIQGYFYQCKYDVENTTYFWQEIEVQEPERETEKVILFEIADWTDSTAQSVVYMNENYTQYDLLYFMLKDYQTGEIDTKTVVVADFPVFESTAENGTDYHIKVAGVKIKPTASNEVTLVNNVTDFRINTIIGIKL